MNPDEELRQAKIGDKIAGSTVIMVPVFVVGSCITALWVPAYVGILMLIAFVASVAVAVWEGYFRHASGDPDTVAWYWPAQFPFVQVLLLVPSLVAAWWSWRGRAAALGPSSDCRDAVLCPRHTPRSFGATNRPRTTPGRNIPGLRRRCDGGGRA